MGNGRKSLASHAGAAKMAIYGVEPHELLAHGNSTDSWLLTEEGGRVEIKETNRAVMTVPNLSRNVLKINFGGTPNDIGSVLSYGHPASEPSIPITCTKQEIFVGV